MVAIKRGAGLVWGVDVDPIALEVAAKNLRENHIRNVVLKDSLQGCRRKFDGIVANILLDALLGLKMDFIRQIKPGGFLILSGVRYQDCEELLGGYKGFQLMERRNRKGWSALLFRKTERDINRLP
jgi:ribosomal protein L11 methyltransferase